MRRRVGPSVAQLEAAPPLVQPELVDNTADVTVAVNGKATTFSAAVTFAAQMLRMQQQM